MICVYFPKNKIFEIILAAELLISVENVNTHLKQNSSAVTKINCLEMFLLFLYILCMSPQSKVLFGSSR